MPLTALPSEVRSEPAPVGTDSASAMTQAYDRAVLACNSGDYIRAHRAIGVLRSALELDSSSSRAFDRFFHWCEVAIDRADYANASRCLVFLRSAWVRASLETEQLSRALGELPHANAMT